MRLKRIGLNGHPCLTPARTGTSSVKPTEVRILVEAPVYDFIINSIKDGGTPMWDSVVEIVLCGMLPKAFLRSSQAR